jgi:hypothetical protein
MVAVSPIASPAAETQKVGGLFGKHLEELGRLGSRTEGSAAEAGTIAYIRGIAAAAGLDLRESPLADLADDHSYSRALTIHFDGKRSDLLVFIVPLDGHSDGPSAEGDAGIALALAGAEDLLYAMKAGMALPISVEFCFLGGERRGTVAEGVTSSAGSNWWIDNIDESRATAVVYLSLDRAPGTLGLHNASLGVLSPYWFYDRTRQALAGSGFEYTLSPNRMQGYRLGLLARPGPLVPYLGAGIPALELRSEAGGAVLADPVVAFDKFLRSLVAGNSGGFLDLWDRDYSPFQVGSFSFVVREGPYVLLLLGFISLVAMVVLGLSIARRGRIPDLMRKLPRRLGNLALLLLLALFAFLSTWFCLKLETAIIGSPDAWTLRPALFSLGRLVVTLSVFLGCLSLFVSWRWLSPDPWFYEVAALILLGLDVLLFAFISLPLSVYFCWGFALTLVSILVRKPLASILAIVFLYLPFALLVAEMIATPESSLLAALFTPDPVTVWILAIAILPFASLTASPLLFLAPRGEGRRRVAAAVFISIAVLVEASLVVIADAAARTGPILFSETIDQDAGTFRLDLKTRARMGEAELTRGGRTFVLRSETDKAMTSGDEKTRMIAARITARAFLDRVTHGVTLSFVREPDSLELRLDSKRPLTIYDCSQPYHVSLDGLSARVFVGPGMPNPLRLEITTSPDFAASLGVRAIYSKPLYEYRSPGPRLLRPGRFSVAASFDIVGSPR